MAHSTLHGHSSDDFLTSGSKRVCGQNQVGHLGPVTGCQSIPIEPPKRSHSTLNNIFVDDFLTNGPKTGRVQSQVGHFDLFRGVAHFGIQAPRSYRYLAGVKYKRENTARIKRTIEKPMTK